MLGMYLFILCYLAILSIGFFLSLSFFFSSFFFKKMKNHYMFFFLVVSLDILSRKY